MQEMQANPVHHGPELRYRIHPQLLGPPVVAVPPVRHQPGDALDHLVVLADRVAGLAVRHTLPRRQPDSREPPGQITPNLVGNGDLERPRLGHDRHPIHGRAPADATYAGPRLACFAADDFERAG